MRHIDEDTLALLALDEQSAADNDALAHLRSCDHCREQLTELRAVVSTVRAGGPLHSPPPRVWDGIEAQMAAETPAHRTPQQAATPRPSGRSGAHRDRPPRGTPRRTRRSRVAWAVFGVIVGVVGTLVVQWMATPEPAARVVAQAALEPLPGWSEAGTARVEEVDGHRILRVALPGEAAQGFREVWLLDSAGEQLVSVGLMPRGEAVFELPDDLDLGEFDVVDVSREPYDGDPAHSGDSIVRGRLQT